MTSPKPQESGNHRSFETFYRPLITRAGIFCAGLVVLLQAIGVFSRTAGGLALLGVIVVLLLVLTIGQRLSDK